MDELRRPDESLREHLRKLELSPREGEDTLTHSFYTHEHDVHCAIRLCSVNRMHIRRSVYMVAFYIESVLSRYRYHLHKCPVIVFTRLHQMGRIPHANPFEVNLTALFIPVDIHWDNGKIEMLLSITFNKTYCKTYWS